MPIFKFFIKFILIGAFFYVLYWAGSILLDQMSFSDRSWLFERDKRYRMKADTPLLQKFRAKKDGLAKLEINFSNADTKPSDSGELRFKLMDHDCSEVIRQKDIFLDAPESDVHEFIFDQIADSKDKIFCLSAEYSPKPGTGTIQILFSKKLHPDHISLFENGNEIKSRSLSMRPAYLSDNLQSGISELNQRMSQYKPWFLKHYFLYIIALGFIILSIFLIIILIVL